MEETIEIVRFSCAICLSDEIEEREQCTTNCNHAFCLPCLNNWFNQNNTSCPLCRDTIINYDTIEGKHYIISVGNNNNNNNNINNNNINYLEIVLQLKNRIYYMSGVLFISMLWFIYSLYQNNILMFQRDQYEMLYTNCTHRLTISNQLIEIMNDYNSLSTVQIYLNNYLYNCFFPLYYVDKCYLSIPGQH